MNREDTPESSDEAARQTITHRWTSNESPSWSVIEAVAEATETEPEHLRPLYDVVDPDALDAMFDADADPDDESATVSVSFQFEGCSVTVRGDGKTIVRRPPSTAEES